MPHTFRYVNEKTQSDEFISELTETLYPLFTRKEQKDNILRCQRLWESVEKHCTEDGKNTIERLVKEIDQTYATLTFRYSKDDSEEKKAVARYVNAYSTYVLFEAIQCMRKFIRAQDSFEKRGE